MIRLLGCPIPERRAEPVRHRRDLVLLERLRERRRGDPPPARHRDTSPVRSPSFRAASRTSSARSQSATLSRFAFIRAAGTVHTAPAVSTSSHVASRTSPDRAALSTRNSNASLTAGCATPPLNRPLTVSMAAATSCLPVRHGVLLRTEHGHHPVARVVVPQVHGDAPLQHRADALADFPGRRRLDVSDGQQDLQHVGRVDLGDGRLPMRGNT